MRFKKPGISVVTVFIALLFSTAVTSARAQSSIFDPFKYGTLGVWASTPLGLSGRIGLALPINKEASITFGNEFGQNGNKQFVGLRVMYAGHGIGWGGIELAHWKTRAHPIMADEQTDYYGLEVQLILFRAGFMIPSGTHHQPRITLGAGLSF